MAVPYVDVCIGSHTLVSGTAVMTPVADTVGTNITASARGGGTYDGYTAWTAIGTDENGNETDFSRTHEKGGKVFES